jgi:hypothetical protein
LTDTGTAVAFLFSSNSDLFLAETLALVAASEIRSGLARRVLTNPSGLLGEFDRKLFVSLLLGGAAGIGFPVSGREDAEGNRDAGLKVQIDDLSGREEAVFSQPSVSDERKTRRSLLLLYLERSRKKWRRKTGSLLELDFF